ncbi:MAG: methionyl-tRNA formyltransferase [Nitrospinaceae bacterium]|nr:MAG: methionyl-tRNA formyltransferase [Nitrospinaceae bacterium]
MKIVFMGTPEFSLPTLKNLVSSDHQVAAVVTQPDRPKGRGRELAASPVKTFALNSGIDVLQPEKASAESFIEILRKLKPDLIIVVAYGQILRKQVLEIPGRFCMNLHSSLLPKYRGAAPINWAIINGEKETGVTTMKMDEGMDTGDILLTEKTPITDSDNAQTLHDKLSEAGGSLVLESLRRLEDNSLTPLPQDSSQASYAPKLKKEDGLIHWEKDAVSLRNLVRGLEPWPGAFTYLNSKRLRLCAVETTSGEKKDQPGEIARLTDHGIEVGSGKGRLIITELQPEGKKRMSAKSFLAGHKMTRGERFEASLTPCTPNTH